MQDISPTARSLLALEAMQDSPGISAERLATRLAVSERAVRRYVAILREAGIPIESTPGRYGGYRVGRGFRLPPLMFSNAEALGLVMAVLQGRSDGADPADPAAAALAKIIRVLPEPVAEPAKAIRQMSTQDIAAQSLTPNPETTTVLVQACAAQVRLRLGYRVRGIQERDMEVDPWSVSVLRGRWYLLCWSHTSQARRILRVDRISAVTVLTDRFAPPADLDPIHTIEEHLAEGWRYQINIVIDAPLADVTRWIPRRLGRLEPIDEQHTRLLATTDEPDWYCRQLLALPVHFRIVEPAELRDAASVMIESLLHAGGRLAQD